MPWYDTQGKIQALVPGVQSTLFPTCSEWPGFPGRSRAFPRRLLRPGTTTSGRARSWLFAGFTDGVLGKMFGGPGKTSIRAAFGIYYTSVEDLNLFYEVADAPFGLYWTYPGIGHV